MRRALAAAVAGAVLASTAVEGLSDAARDQSSGCLNQNRPGLQTFPTHLYRERKGTPGRVISGSGLDSQLVTTPPYRSTDPLLAYYPGGTLPKGRLRWRNTAHVARSHLVYASHADAVFNGDNARYRIAFNQSYFGVDPVNIGNFTGSGIDDLAIPSHYAYVDGKAEAGEVDIYDGRRGQRIDPRTDVPDTIFYGDQRGAKFGIAVARAGDVNGDGYDDLLIAAAFHTVRTPDGKFHPYAGKVYLVYGGYLDRFRCPVKIRAQDIGTRIPGIVFDGGADGGQYLGYQNELDSGDFSGDGLSDIVIGEYNPYPAGRRTFATRAFVIYGSRKLPRHLVNYRLGVDTNRDGIRSTIYTLPGSQLTREPGGFSASFVGALTGNGHDTLAFTAGRAGPQQNGEAFFFFRPPPPGRVRVKIESAPLRIYADMLKSPPLTFGGLQGVRPNGDVYGDGHRDALLTARYTRNGATYVGAVGVLRGRAHLPRRLGFSKLNTIIYGSEPGSAGQPSMAHAADLNGDGCTDILINDPYYEERIGGTVQDRGRMWLILGRRDLPHLIKLEPAADRILLADNSLPGLFGFNWDVGDFDGSGRPDLVIADHYAGDRELHDFAGRTYLFYNRSLHLRWRPVDGCRQRRLQSS